MNRFTKVIFDGKPKKIKETSCRGSVLVEFAVCMPLLIVLLFYIYDLIKIRRYYSQTNFIGRQIANIIQNISRGRGASELKITQNDLKYALCFANLSLLPGTTMYTQDEHYLGYTTWVQVYRVVGDGSGNAKCTSRIELSAWNGQKSPEKVWYACTSGNHVGSKVRYSSEAVPPSQIYSALKMGSRGNIEEKIVIDVCLLTDSTIRPAGKSTEKQILGLHQAMPPFLTNGDDKLHFYFHSVIIFTPRNGLFSDSCPPEPET